MHRKVIEVVNPETGEVEVFEKLERRHVLGKEVPDQTPIELPVGYHKTPSLMDQVKAYVTSLKAHEAAQAGGYESYEEANDFGDDEDDHRPLTPAEIVAEFGEMERAARRQGPPQAASGALDGTSAAATTVSPSPAIPMAGDAQPGEGFSVPAAEPPVKKA